MTARNQSATPAPRVTNPSVFETSVSKFQSVAVLLHCSQKVFLATKRIITESALSGIPDMAYRLQLGDDNKITWHATIDGKQVIETKEPQTSGWRRFQAWFLKIAPEKQL